MRIEKEKNEMTNVIQLIQINHIIKNDKYAKTGVLTSKQEPNDFNSPDTMKLLQEVMMKNTLEYIQKSI